MASLLAQHPLHCAFTRIDSDSLSSPSCTRWSTKRLITKTEKQHEMPSSCLLTDVSADVWKGCARRAVAAVVARLCASVRYTQKYANDIWHHRSPRPSSVAPCWRKALNAPSTHTHTTTSCSKLLVLLLLRDRWKEWKDVDFCFLCLCFYCEIPTELNGTLHSSSFITWCHCTECNISTRLTEWLFCVRSVWSGNRSLKAWPVENC